MASTNTTLLFTFSLLLALILISNNYSPCLATRILLEDIEEPELPPFPEIPDFPKPELPPFPELPSFPEFPPFPEIPTTLTKQEESNSVKVEEPKLPLPELPPLPEIPLDFPKPELPPLPEIPHLLPEEPKHP